MNIHLIAIGGAVMHNLAIALKLKGFRVTGSDDEIFEPSNSRLTEHGLLPEEPGWFPEKITKETDVVILGMHARADNPELKRAQELDIKIFSFPEYLYEQTQNKKRIVIAGSHGKTTITSMILHVLKYYDRKFDYMVGSQIEGFDTMVGLSEDSDIAVFEGDEYLSSTLDSRPKFAHYKPHITLISGIAWDHINVYPDYSGYRKQFFQLGLDTHPKGKLFFCESDEELINMNREWAEQEKNGKELAERTGYRSMEFDSHGEQSIIHFQEKKFRVSLIGKYNMENLAGAMKVCRELGIHEPEFLKAMEHFRGAARRQELLFKSEKLSVYRDFAHAPSKVRATVHGFRESFKGKKLIAFLEIHTFSSLNRNFLPHYKDSMAGADEAYVYFNPEVVRMKKQESLTGTFVRECFGEPGVKVIDSVKELEELFHHTKRESGVVLLMSSGNFGAINTGILFNEQERIH